MSNERPAEKKTLWQRLGSLFGGQPAEPVVIGPPPRVVPSPGPEADPAFGSLVFKLPKVDLRVRLEGCLRPASMLILAKDHGLEPPGADEAAIRRSWRYADRAGFAEARRKVDRCLQRPEDFALLVRELVAEQAVQSILHTEAVVDVSAHLARGIEGRALASALADAVAEAPERYGITVALLAEVRLDLGTELAREALAWAVAASREQVPGIVLTGVHAEGSNGLGPLGSFAETARDSGLGVVLGLGDSPPTDLTTDGPPLDSLLRAIEPDRLEDVTPLMVGPWTEDGAAERLADYSSDSGGHPILVSPTFDLAVGPVESWQEHPWVRLGVLGAELLPASGSPQLCQTHLSRELANLHRAYDLSPESLVERMLTAARHAFLSEERRSALVERVRQGAKSLGVEAAEKQR